MFVSAVLDPLDDAIQQPARMEMRPQRTLVVPGADAIAVESSNEAGAFSRPHDVAVYPHNPGQCPSVSFHIGRAVVSLARDYVVVILIEASHSGIVPENRHHPVLSALDA